MMNNKIKKTMGKRKMTRRDFCKLGGISLIGAGLGMVANPACSGKKTTHSNIQGSPNFIIFLVDMLRPDHLGLHGYTKKTSPNIDRLARQAIVFDNAYAPSPWTYPSVVSLLTGLTPISHGAAIQGTEIILPKTDSWLPAVFKENGYNTVCFYTHPFLRKEVSNIHTAFAGYYDPSEKKRGAGRFSDYMYLDTLYPACENWIEKNHRQPFFMYIHVIDVHGPYNKVKLLDEDKAKYAELLRQKYRFPRLKEYNMYAASTKKPNPHKSLFYDGHIFSVDKYFAKLYDKLQALGIGENTFLILTSDHGEGFGEHNQWNHGLSMYEPQIRIPLIIYSHRFARQKAGRIPGIVNSVGLLPTLLDTAAIKTNKNIDGKSFLSLIPDRPEKWKYSSLSDVCRKKEETDPDSFMTDVDFKLVSDKKSGKQHLFDLKADPGELHPLNLSAMKSKRHRGAFSYLVQKRKEFLKTIDKRGSMKKMLQKNSLEHLKTLGYF
ncbi:MAG: sulfatase [Candidatus Aminicenantes bacterium]|nr:sulfatase [Candidatus Aminicenantes bacterium]